MKGFLFARANLVKAYLATRAQSRDIAVTVIDILEAKEDARRDLLCGQSSEITRNAKTRTPSGKDSPVGIATAVEVRSGEKGKVKVAIDATGIAGNILFQSVIAVRRTF